MLGKFCVLVYSCTALPNPVFLFSTLFIVSPVCFIHKHSVFLNNSILKFALVHIAELNIGLQKNSKIALHILDSLVSCWCLLYVLSMYEWHILMSNLQIIFLNSARDEFHCQIRGWQVIWYFLQWLSNTRIGKRCFLSLHYCSYSSPNDAPELYFILDFRFHRIIGWPEL